MDPITTAIYIADILLSGISAWERYQQLSAGISARAQAEGRDVTDQELDIIKAALTAAEKARKGQ